MKKGTYYIGDPCYVFEESWDEVLESTNYFEEKEGVYTIFGEKIVCGKTAYGDGIYQDNEGREYYVDAALIAILPVSLLCIDNKRSIDEIENDAGMHIVEFEEDFDSVYNDGKYRFGHITINTK